MDIFDIYEDEKSCVYIWIDSGGRLVRLEGSYTLPEDLTDGIMIEEGEPCDRLNLAQTHYLEKPIRDERGVCRYKYQNSEIIERSQAEMDADYVEPTPVPSQMDRIEAQVLFTAVMTDTLIEED